MGGSARYRYGKKIASAREGGASEDEIRNLERQRDEAIAREKARQAERLAKSVIVINNAYMAELVTHPVTGRSVSKESRLRKVESAQEFHDALVNAKNSQDIEKAWRVDSLHEVSDYERDGDDLYMTEGGSTIAVKKNGDIISVCRNKNDVGVRGDDLLARAVAMGGTKLDSYEKNHNFYIRNGFEPVSWCKWDDAYNDYAKQNGWDENRDEREPIIFYRYVGHPVTEKADEFMRRVPASADYDTAQGARDRKL